MVDILLQQATTCNYRTNCISMPFTALIRHSVELYQKLLQSRKGLAITKNHFLMEDKELFSDDFVSKMSVLKPHQDGAQFRYKKDRNGNLYDLQQYSIKDVLLSFISLCKDHNLYQFTANTDVTGVVENRKFNWELTFHPYEIDNEGLMCSQYRNAIDRVLSMVNLKVINIEDIVLPLFFCIRHYVEISIKSNTNKIKQPGLKQTHNLKKELEVLEEYINRTFTESNCDETDVKETYEIISVAQKLVAIFDRIDCKSTLFRYPNAKCNEITIAEHNISSVLKLCQGKFEHAPLVVTYLQECGYVCDFYD